MTRATFAAYAHAARTTHGPDAELVAAIDTTGPGTIGPDRPDMPFISATAEPAASAFVIVAAPDGYHAGEIVAYRGRHGIFAARFVTSRRYAAMADAWRNIAGDVSACDLDYVGV